MWVYFFFIDFYKNGYQNGPYFSVYRNTDETNFDWAK